MWNDVRTVIIEALRIFYYRNDLHLCHTVHMYDLCPCIVFLDIYAHGATASADHRPGDGVQKSAE